MGRHTPGEPAPAQVVLSQRLPRETFASASSPSIRSVANAAMAPATSRRSPVSSLARTLLKGSSPKEPHP
jgi:hypothetical protein